MSRHQNNEKDVFKRQTKQWMLLIGKVEKDLSGIGVQGWCATVV